jgi:hypothetical protein
LAVALFTCCPSHFTSPFGICHNPVIVAPPLTAMDFVALRVEIKAWEREFKTDNGRDPTIKDIKDRPDLGAVLT